MSLQAAALYALVGVQGAGQSVRDLQSVSNQVNKTKSVMAGVAKGAGQMSKGFVQVGQGILRIGEFAALAAVGATAASAKIGASFQATMELIHTQAGASQQEVVDQTRAVQALVHEVGTTPQELAAGLYHIESVGLRGAAAMDVLRASAIGAKVGLADMESVTNALTAVWFSGIKGAKSMTDAMAILDGIVGVGNMHLQDLTDSFKSGILGTAATFGVDIRSLGAAIATLTDAGVPANIAATRLNMTLSHMAAPVPKAIDTLKKLGIGQFDLANDLRKPDGIFVALQDLHDALAKAGDIKNGQLTPQGADALTKIFGGSRFGATAMQLLTQMDRVQQKYGLITQRSQTFGDNVKATMQTAGFVWGQFKADIENAALSFSEGFLPALARAGSKLDGFLVGHQSDIKGLGVELGNWLDNINWQQVEDGANTFLGIMKTVLEIVGKIPPQVDAAVVAFLGLNKVSGGLLGKGLENIVGGATGIVGALARAGGRSLLSKIPVVGNTLAAATSTPVFVTNWPLGFGLGGGLPGAAAAGAAEAGGLTLATAAGAALVGTAIAAAAFAGLTALYDATATDAQKAALQGTVNDQERLKRGFGLHNDGGTSTGAGKAADDTSLAAAIDRQNTDTRSENAGIRRAIEAGNGDTHSEAVRIGQAATALVAAAHKQVSAASQYHYLLKGIAARGEKKSGHAPSQAAITATFGRDLLRYTHTLVGSSKTTAEKLAGVERFERIAVAAKDWGVAHKLKEEIAALKRQEKADAANAGRKLGNIATDIINKKLSVRVGGPTVITNVRMGVGETIKTTTTAKRLGNVYIE